MYDLDPSALRLEPLRPKHYTLNTKPQVYLLAATLRPETMYGQTNCWMLPHDKEGNDVFYGAYRTHIPGEVVIVGERAAANMAHQEMSPKFGEVSPSREPLMDMSPRCPTILPWISPPKSLPRQKRNLPCMGTIHDIARPRFLCPHWS